jgi:signal transduction histidine kinase
MKEILRRLRGDASAGIALLLAAAGALACVLVLQAHSAARTHRHAAEQTLRDYARFAGWQLGRQVEDGVLDSLNVTVSRVLFFNGYDFRHLRRPDDTPDVAAARRLFERTMTEETAWCGCPDALHTLFTYSARTGEIAAGGSPVLADAEGWLRREMVPRTGRALAYIRAEARPVRLSDGTRATLPARPSDAIWVDDVTIGGRELKLAYTPILGDDGGLGGAEVVFGGFLYDPARVARPVMEMLLSYKPLLPPTLTGAAPNERTLAIVAASLDGDTVYRTAGALPAGELVAVDTIRHDYVSLVTHVAVRPEVADALVIGGLPRSRLPLLAVTLALTLGLGIVALLQLRRQAELVRLRGDFVSGVSHELRTPLAQIQLFADLLAAPWLPEHERANSVRVIGEEARRLGYLVGNVLRFSGAERGASTVRPLRQEIAPLLESAVESFAPLARASGTVVRFGGAPAATVPVDADALRQVLLNLLDNASKYAPGTEVRLGAEAGGDGWMRIRVDDGGPGIPAEERELVWQPFRRLDRDARSAAGGSGIGLSIVRTLVEGHGGRVTVGDAPGGGARFTVELPGAEMMMMETAPAGRIEPAREVA